jgi:hypothetical protein
LVHEKYQKAAMASAWNATMNPAVTQLSVESEYAVRTACRSVVTASPVRKKVIPN